MQLLGSNQALGVSILTLSSITDWCQESGGWGGGGKIASVPIRKTTLVVFIGLPGN